jgi:hypothetical protein
MFCTLEAVMLSPRAVLVLAALSWVPTAYAQTSDENKKAADPAGQTEVRFTDDSVVRMSILQEQLEIVTKYGKLTVPTSDIIKVDFGLRVPADLQGKIAKALEDLNSDIYKTRELATKDLVSWGPFAYPQLYKAAKSSQLEVQKRAVVALDQLKAKHPARNLRLREEDLVVTPNFTIVGHIVTPTLKARAENFGELDLNIGKLRGISWLAATPEIQVTVDAAKHCVPGQWLDTGYEVRQESQLHVVATGQVNLFPQNVGANFICNPRGIQNGQMAPGLPHPPGVLLGRIGQDGPMFVIGEQYNGSPNREGKLYLHIAPSPWNPGASVGSYNVKIGPKGFQSGD